MSCWYGLETSEPTVAGEKGMLSHTCHYFQKLCSFVTGLHCASLLLHFHKLCYVIMHFFELFIEFFLKFIKHVLSFSLGLPVANCKPFSVAIFIG